MMDEDIMIGKNLRRIRMEKGISQEYLGAFVGVPQQRIHEYEKAKVRVTAAMLLKLANALEVRPQQLFGDNVK